MTPITIIQQTYSRLCAENPLTAAEHCISVEEVQLAIEQGAEA